MANEGITNLVRSNFRGAWASDYPYEVKDVCQSNGSLYYCVMANTNSEPPSANWTLMVSKGDAGDAGQGGQLPIGFVFISVVSTNPATLLGYGTWEAFGAGRVLVGVDSGDTDFDTAEETGGAKTSNAVMNHIHTITDSGHSHLQRYGAATGNFKVHVGDTSGGGTGGSAAPTDEQMATASGTANCTSANPAGGVASFSIMNPYLVCYFFKRTE